MVKLYVIGGKLPLFTQEASFMEYIYLSIYRWEIHFPGEIRLMPGIFILSQFIDR